MSSSDDPLQFDPTTKTKPQLQAWLVDHDQYPSRPGVTKDELIRLVREHQTRLRTRQTPTRTISSPQTKIEREHAMAKVKAIEAMETPNKKLAVTHDGILVEQWGAGWERSTTIATPPSATSVLATKGRTSLGTTLTSTPTTTSTSTSTSTVSTTARKKRRLAERDDDDEEETSTSKPTARKRAAASDHKYAPMRDENEMDQDIEPDVELPTKKRRVTKSFVAPDLLLPSAEAIAAHAPTKSPYHTTTKPSSDDNMHVDETNNNNISSPTFPVVSPPKIPNPFQQAAFVQPEPENGEQSRRSRASLPSETISRPTKRSTKSLGAAFVRGEANDEEYQSLFTPMKTYLHGVETPDDQARLSSHRPVMAELQQRLIQQQQQQQQHTSPQPHVQAQVQDHGLRQRVIRTSPQMDRIAVPPPEDGFIPATPRTPESTSPRDTPPTPRSPIKPASLLTRIHSYLSATWSAFIHLLHFLLRMLVIILALILIVLVYQQYLHHHFRTPTKFCTSEGVESNHDDEPRCVPCPVSEPVGFCRNHDLICHSPYVRDGDTCVESKELQKLYYKLKDEAVWLLERTAGEYECGYHKNHGLTRDELREKLFQQYQHACTNHTASPAEISQFDHAFPRMMSLLDSQLSTLSLERQGSYGSYTYISQNPDRPIQCQIKELIMEHRTELAIAAFIITTAAWLYRTISLWRWRRAQVPLLEGRIQSELLTSYEALAIDHLRDQLWRGQDAKVWERVVKRIAKDSRIQLTRQKKGGSTRDCWMWIASKPTLVNTNSDMNPTQPQAPSSAGAEPTFAPATFHQ